MSTATEDGVEGAVVAGSASVEGGDGGSDELDEGVVLEDVDVLSGAVVVVTGPIVVDGAVVVSGIVVDDVEVVSGMLVDVVVPPQSSDGSTSMISPSC